MQPHPDRLAVTLANRTPTDPARGDEPAPARGSADCRVDLKLLLWRARKALAERGNEAARTRFAAVDAAQLLAGTVQDGVARGVMVALEEVIHLCDGAEAPPIESLAIDADAEVFTGRELRRKKDIVVASGGARIRWSRKGGALFVDRRHGVHEEDCIRFEDLGDHGDLDGFVADPTERPRLFSPAFIRPVRLVHAHTLHRLDLEGRLGRRADGHPCELTFIGRPEDEFVHLVVRLRNDRDDHRLRIRFLGCRIVDAIGSDGTPGHTIVTAGNRHFLAATLVRAHGTLRAGDQCIAVPGAQCHGIHRHVFRLGGRRWRIEIDPDDDASKDR